MTHSSDVCTFDADDFTWDVFVSHNHQQKLWVRAAVAQWRKLGLRVFFDEDSILPGETILAGVERGLVGSRDVALIITPQSAASGWVALETAVFLHASCRDKRRRIFPLLLAPTPLEQLPLAVQMRQFIDLTDRAARVANYRRFLRLLAQPHSAVAICLTTRHEPIVAVPDGEAGFR